jgi:hypothetical protein
MNNDFLQRCRYCRSGCLEMMSGQLVCDMCGRQAEKPDITLHTEVEKIGEGQFNPPRWSGPPESWKRMK